MPILLLYTFLIRYLALIYGLLWCFSPTWLPTAMFLVTRGVTRASSSSTHVFKYISYQLPACHVLVVLTGCIHRGQMLEDWPWSAPCSFGLKESGGAWGKGHLLYCDGSCNKGIPALQQLLLNICTQTSVISKLMQHHSSVPMHAASLFASFFAISTTLYQCIYNNTVYLF